MTLPHAFNTLRLLHQGLETSLGRHPAADPLRIAEPFSPEKLADSDLWTKNSPLPLFSTAGHTTQLFLTADGSDQKTEKTDSCTVYLCGESSSSLDVAHELIRRDVMPIWGSVLALSQKTGRGQLGRNWISPPGNVYAALRLPAVPPFTTTAAAPALGGMVAEALTDLGFPVSMKWPNDILQKDSSGTWRKVGGLLIEERRISSEPPSPVALVAGIGLNLNAIPTDTLMRANHALPAGRLMHIMPQSLSIACLWRRLVCRLLFCYANRIDMKDARAWKTVAERHLAFVGQTVLITDGPDDQDRHMGILEGLDDSGALRLRGWKEGFLSGSLSVPIS